MIDIHAHLDNEIFDKDFDLILERCFRSGINKIIIPSINFESITKVIDITQRFNNTLPAIGLHPHEIENLDLLASKQILEKFLNNTKFIAISEIGLDFYYDKDFEKKQIEFLEMQLELGEKYNLPVILHIREAFDRMFEILKTFNIKNPIWHSFTGNLDEARKFIDLGGYISLSGLITFKKSDSLRKIIKYLPLERIFCETDSPYLTPEPYRGKRNEPLFVKLIYEKICEIKGIDLEYLEKIIEDNFKNVFGNF